MIGVESHCHVCHIEAFLERSKCGNRAVLRSVRRMFAVKSHPVADEYALLSENEYRDLVEDIRKRGLLIPIVVDTEGSIIDGRHRWRACEEIGIKCRKVTFVGTDEEKRAHAKSLNVYRRHLTESQRGMAAAKTVNVVNGTNQHARKEGVPRGIPSKTVTIEDASRKAKVSRRTVARAVKVLKEGTPDLVKAVEDAVVTVAVAEKILKLPKEQQAAAIETGVVKPIEKPLSEQFAEALEPLMKKLELLDTGSEEAVKISELLSKASAKATSRACDTKPIEHDQPKTHIEAIEDATVAVKKTVKQLKAYESWDESPERKRSVRLFLKVTRDAANAFEKHASVGAEPDKTLFEADAEIPEHLQEEPFLSAWESWWTHRKKTKKSVTQVTKNRQLNLLKTGDAKQAALIVSKAEENGWQGIPDAVWIPKHDKELWDGRMPVHADAELRKRIEAALNSNNGFKPSVNQSTKHQAGKFDPTRPKMTLEEQIARAKR